MFKLLLLPPSPFPPLARTFGQELSASAVNTSRSSKLHRCSNSKAAGSPFPFSLPLALRCPGPSTVPQLPSCALSFAHSLFCPFSSEPLPLPSSLFLLSPRFALTFPLALLPWWARLRTAGYTYDCMVFQPPARVRHPPHPSGLLTPSSSPETQVWMAQGIILHLLSSSRDLRPQTHGHAGSSLVSIGLPLEGLKNLLYGRPPPLNPSTRSAIQPEDLSCLFRDDFDRCTCPNFLRPYRLYA